MAALGSKTLRVLAYLDSIEDRFVVVKDAHILDEKGNPIAYSTVRYAITNLIAIHAILHKEQFVRGAIRGVKYELNEDVVQAMYDIFPELLREKTTYVQNEHQDYHQNWQQVEHQHWHQPNLRLSSSSSLEKRIKTTATSEVPEIAKCDEGPSEAPEAKKSSKLTSHPEYSFWRQQGLAQKQIESWKSEFELSEELLDTYLRWASWAIDAENKKGDEGKKIESPQNWFYHMLKRTGAYPKPVDYVSYEEKKLIAQREALEEKERIAKQQAELHTRELELEIGRLADEIIEQGDSHELYAQATDGVGAFILRSPNRALLRSIVQSKLRKMFGVDG